MSYSENFKKDGGRAIRTKKQVDWSYIKALLIIAGIAYTLRCIITVFSADTQRFISIFH